MYASEDRFAVLAHAVLFQFFPAIQYMLFNAFSFISITVTVLCFLLVFQNQVNLIERLFSSGKWRFHGKKHAGRTVSETVYELAADVCRFRSCRDRKILVQEGNPDCCLHLKIWRQSQIWKNTVSRCLTVSGKQWKRPLRCHRDKKRPG